MVRRVGGTVLAVFAVATVVCSSCAEPRTCSWSFPRSSASARPSCSPEAQDDSDGFLRPKPRRRPAPACGSVSLDTPLNVGDRCAPVRRSPPAPRRSDSHGLRLVELRRAGRRARLAGARRHDGCFYRRVGTALTISGFAYDPTPLTVSPGEVVSAKNLDSAEHTVTSDTGGLFKGDDIKQGKIVTFKAPAKPGTYTFHCEYHASMHGTLVIK